MNNKKGFTLMELLIVLAILAILLVSTLPSLSSFIAKNKKNALLTDMYSTLALAQGETVKRRVAVTIRPSSATKWELGWTVFTDINRNGIQDGNDELLNTLSYSDNLVALKNSNALQYLIFKPNGLIISSPASTTLNIYSCAKGVSKTKSVIKIQSSGNYRIINNEISCI